MTIRARRGRSRRPGLERLEGRALLNASIDIADDGSIVYRTDPAAPQSLLVSTTGGVYTFAVNPGEPPIDVTNNSSLVVTGDGTRTVTVANPSGGIRIEAASAGQTIRVRSTALPMVIDLQADSERVILGDDQGAGAVGLRALAASITVASASTFTSNSLTVDDGAATYGPGVRPTYRITSTAIAAPSATGFVGVSYTGLARVTLKGTSAASVDSPLYLVTGTAGGVVTTIDGSAGPASRDFSVVGTSSSPGSMLRLLSAGSANLYVSSMDSPVYFNAGNGRSTVQVEAVRGGASYGLDSDLVLNGGGGTIDVQVSNFWNTGARRGNPNWALGLASPTSPYAVMRDSTNPNVGGLFFRPGEVHSLGLNATGNRGASLLVDFRDGDPLPTGSAPASNAPRSGLTYVGAAGLGAGAGYALAFVGSPPAGAFASQAHTAFPLYRGQIEMVAADGGTRRVAYQLDPAAPLFDDSAAVESYRWFYDIMNGGNVPPETDSTLGVIDSLSTVIQGQGLMLREANPAVRLARYFVAGKTDVRISRGWSLGTVTTVLDYSPERLTNPDGTTTIPPVVGLSTLMIDDASPQSTPNDDVVQLHAAPPGTSIFVVQNFGADSAYVRLTGLEGVIGVGLDAGTSSTEGQPDTDTLYIDAGGLRLGAANIVGLGPNAIQIPALAPESATVSARNYEEVRVANSSAPMFEARPTAIAATAQVPLVDVTAGILIATIPGLTFAGLTATIAWGDGTASLGIIQAVPGSPGTYRVIGSHTYGRSGVFTPVIRLSGTSDARTVVSNVGVTFEVSGTSGTTAPAPSLGVFLTPGSDSGVSSSDLITNVVRPTFVGASGSPGARIDLYAAARGGGPLIPLGSTTADASGGWAITAAAPLIDGDYTIQAVSTTASTAANGTANLAGPLRIDTLGPRVWGVAVDPLARAVQIYIRDHGGAGDAGSALFAAELPGNYVFGPMGVQSVQTAPPWPATATVVTLRTARPIRQGAHTLTILSGRNLATGQGIFDAAGNPLDGAYAGSFPSGGANTARDFRARLTIRNNRLASILPA
ncbi:Ig-like domain-containing protein [Paludisphaera sp.]|uniref:Ig-like domain-containing protein n=1 Tax=Paludisphaera sp. TaxID=2017432 RepID=UPI00301CD163